MTTISVSYTGGPGFKHRLGDRYSEFRGLLQFLQASFGILPKKLDHDSIAPNPLHFIITITLSFNAI
jgi:hypothetical protein